ARLQPPAATLGYVGSDQETTETTGINENRQPKTPSIVRAPKNMGLFMNQSFGVAKIKTEPKKQRYETIQAPATRKGFVGIRSMIVSANLKTKRKRKTRLSATQLAARDSVAAFKAKVFSLELDILNLRQQHADVPFHAFLMDALRQPLPERDYLFSCLRPRQQGLCSACIK
ncbi:hypothetical protein BBJ28_00004820, partial [Nothophytophthora sp. Chile5]